MDTKKIILIVVIVVLLLFAIAGFALGFSSYKNNGDKNKNKDAEKNYITLEEMYCNIKDSKKIVKIKATIEINNKNTYEELEGKQFLMRNEINKIIRSKEENELQGKEGQIALQNEIKENLIKLFNNESITNVFFDDLIIQ
ncbi:flagellar basal body-associated FliL family protein [Anaerosalibacter bizertensis]|uniref:Flagellar protein FliL n=1 Tax=Anaerosalibacter bizertensis TaxID=932217 RepID=A0A9Q4ABP6_9FIRM|nr:flagellar basal body-associated FliL family protein [Anaerosalibacter bizertensis]MBV1818025.1 flagellar basal body-associated FliL family protein [Bacteroidales bacterium MSK.15.36]MCB5560586.1 flagellar basal body-associated FliL family protein [Anaerosalibacter bizertensis]MCG4564645.1 flagellar basal body-associated FliL family protein [Anaerosalibacter bizertensis]MCG4582660.1 flagellar basal body-associated FliL family protein [Anaerosalibacter bizertensis]MCG4584595.1 flagellar basal